MAWLKLNLLIPVTWTVEKYFPLLLQIQSPARPFTPPSFPAAYIHINRRTECEQETLNLCFRRSVKCVTVKTFGRKTDDGTEGLARKLLSTLTNKCED